MKKSKNATRASRIVKAKKPVSKNTLYIVSSAIVLLIITAGVSQPQNTLTEAQIAVLTPPAPSVDPTLSPSFGCLGNCPMQITPSISPVTVSPSAGAPVPVVSGAMPGVSAAPGAANPAEQQPAGNPLQFLANPNGKIPPGREKNFLEKLIAFLLQLLGGGGNNPQANLGNGNGNANGQGGNGQGENEGGGGQQAAPVNDPNANPANGGNEQGGNNPNKPGYGNNPGSVNPGGHVVNPAGKGGADPATGAGAGAGAQAGAGASQTGALNQPATQAGGQAGGLGNLLNMIKQLFSGQPAAK